MEQITSLEWQKEQYRINMAAIEAKYKKMAEIWHAKGRKAFNDALMRSRRGQTIPDWNEFFEKEWINFTIIKLKCSECGFVKEIKIDFDANLDSSIFADLNHKYSHLMCVSCGNVIEIRNYFKWK